MRSTHRFKGQVLILDVGRLLLDGSPEDLGQAEARVLSTVRQVPLAYRCVAQEVQRRFGERVWLVSKCRREQAQRNTRAYLEETGFFDQTRVPREHVEFCDTNAGKAPIIRRLKGTVVVDDSLEVHLHLPFVPHRILFRPDPDEVARALRMFSLRQIPAEITVVERGWRNVNQTIVDLLGTAHSQRQRR